MSKLLEAFKKELGDKVRLGNDISEVEALPTGIPDLDVALQIGGYPRGGITMLYGPESVGKSVMSFIAISEAQKRGENCVLIDLEGTFDPKFAAKFGVDVGELVITSPMSAEDVMEHAVLCANNSEVGLFVVDSIGAMASERELEEDGKKQAYGQSGLITNMVKKMQPRIAKNKQVCLLINQVRDTTNTRGLPMVHPPGGHALRHACAVIIQLKPGLSSNTVKAKIEGEGEVEVGYRPTATIKKSKVGSPQRNAEWNFYHTDSSVHPVGIDYRDSLVSASSRVGVITRRGAYYDIPDLDYKAEGPGKERVIEWLNEGHWDELEEAFHNKFNEMRGLNGSKEDEQAAISDSGE